MKPYYQDSAVTIYHGDCREIVPTLGKFDLLLTDPPYGIGFAAQPTTGGRARGQKRESWDDQKPEIMFLLELDSICDSSIIWGGNYFGLPTSKSWLIWSKPDAPPSMGNAELAWTNLGINTKHISHSIAATNLERVGHPTQKPLKVISWCISLAGDEAQTILDPFAGSGTTGRAAKDLGRKATLIEMEEKYCEIAAKRMAQEVLAI